MKRFLSIILSTIILIPILCSVVFAASDYNSYRAEVDKLNGMDIPTQKQAHRMENSSGICNVVAATQLLNRRVAYDLGNNYNSLSNISLSSVITQCGNTVHQVDVVKSGSNRIWYSYSGNGTVEWYNYSYTMPNGFKYAIKLAKKSQIKGDFNEYLTNLLMEHPEGVHYRTPKGSGGHCIVITDFIKNGSGYTFYAIDGTDYRNYGEEREEWTKTSTVWHNGAIDLYNDMDYIAYIDVDNSQIHNCPTELTKENYATLNGVLGACRGCGKAYNWQATFQKTTTQVYELKNSNKNDKVKVRSAPYEDATERSNRVNKNFTVVGTVTNAYGNKWYVVDYQDDVKKMCYTAYVYCKNIDDKYVMTSSTAEAKKYDSGNTVTKSHTHDYNFNNGQCYCGAVKSSSLQNNSESTLKINLTRYPVQHTQGNNFGLRGTISSNYKIKKIYGYIKQNGNIIQSTEDTPNVKSVNVKEQRLNNNLVFETLGAGNYILEVQTVDASGNGITVTKNFSVVGQSAKAESNLSINLDKYPVTLNAGSGFGLRGSVTSNYNIAAVKGYVVNSNGSTVLSSKDTPNSTYMDIRYANLNNDLVFNNLGAGNYVMRVVATDNSGRTVEVSKNFTVVSNSVNSNSDLSINLNKYPVSLELGSSYGLRGSITSNYNISVVKGYVYNSNGQTVLSSVDYPNSTYMDIRPARLNEDLIFNNLTTGNYTMKVVAVDASGRTVEATKNFTVKSKAAYVDNSPNGNGVTGTVVIPSSWDNLSIRTGPSTNYQIIGSMNNGAKCTVYPNKTINGWYYVNYNGIWGYASGRQINLNSSNSASVNTRSGIVNIPSSWDDLSIRTGPSTNYQIVGGMPQGARCTVYSDKAQNGWYYVEYNGVQGYAAGNRINLQ